MHTQNFQGLKKKLIMLMKKMKQVKNAIKIKKWNKLKYKHNINIQILNTNFSVSQLFKSELKRKNINNSKKY